MDIRSVTLFCEPDFDHGRIAAFCTAAREAFPVPVQTLRLATPPFPEWLAPHPDVDLAPLVAERAAGWQGAGADYISLGPVQLQHDPAWLEAIPQIVGVADAVFATATIAGLDGTVDVGRCWQVADVIREVSAKLENGFGNLYLAALAHCPPGAPFFPVAYHRGGPPLFALALETADVALQAIQGADSLAEARGNLVAAIEQTAASLSGPAQALAAAQGIAWQGLDFSLAPFPTVEKSLGGAMEALGAAPVGAPGSLFAAGFITEAIARADFPRCGFSGLMLPVLEDSVLAQRAAEGVLTIQDLLSFAAVCGVGLDTIPLPGDVSRDALAGILLDVAMLAARLRKPLTARLMPLPGLRAGDPVTFDFPYFADSRVMATRGVPLRGLLAQPARLPVQAVPE